MTEPDVVPSRVLACRSCKAPLGQYTGEALSLGAVVITRGVSVRCARCGRDNRWVPAHKNSQKLP